MANKDQGNEQAQVDLAAEAARKAAADAVAEAELEAEIAAEAAAAKAADDAAAVETAPVEDDGMPADYLEGAALSMHDSMGDFIVAAERHASECVKKMDMAAHVKFHNLAMAFAEFKATLAKNLNL